MTTMPDPPPPLYAGAVQYGMRGLRLLPVEHHTRRAILPKWEQNASNGVEFIDTHFGQGRNNIGLCCGPQPNGWNLLVVDVDPQNGGDEAWAELERQHGPLDRKNLCFHRTPSGGVHLFFLVPEGLAVTGTDVLGPGIDCRGGQIGNVGCGYVLLPPSIAASKTTGELLAYGASPGKGCLDRVPTEASEWMLDILTAHLIPEPRQTSVQRHPSNVGGDTPGDWVRANLRWEDYLVKWGWQQKGKYWWRPGKDFRQEHAAELHDDGRFAYWSLTDMPDGMRTLGRPMADGGRSISLFDFIAAYEHGGDRSACGLWVRTELMSQPPPGMRTGVPAPPEAADEPERTVSRLLHPAEFWTQLPLLTTLRDAAWSMGASPDAMLLGWLTHYATAIPPGYRLPPIIGDDGTFDLLSVLVGDSGAKKSSVMRRTERLTPLGQRKDLQVGLDIGSGEGIIEAFYDMLPSDDADPKSKKEKRRAFVGLNFKVDEGKLINDLAHRQGTTHTSRLCSAWSGSTLSTTNASAETKRRINEFSYRLTAVICAQPTYAVAYLHGDSALQGFAQRLLWAWCHDPSKPEPGQRPEWPGILPIEVPAVVGLAYMRCDPEIVAQIQWDDHNEVHVGLDAHRNLLRLKLAGIMVLADDPTSRLITADMWEIAGQIVAQSVVVRDYLLAQETSQRQTEEVAKAEASGRRLALAEDAHDRALLGRTADRILVLLAAHGPLPRKQLKDKLSRPQKPFMDQALDMLMALGKVAGEAGGTWRLI